MLTVLTWLLSGFVAGWLVRVVMGSRRDFGIVGDLVLGSLGGLVGAWLFRHLGLVAPEGHRVQIFVAIIGAALLVAAPRLLRRLVVAGITTFPIARGLEGDLDQQVGLLSDLERRVLARMLKRKPSSEDPNRVFDAQLTFGQRVADQVARFGGSWTFIGLFFLCLVIWMMVNAEMVRAFDPYPFILLNLVLSCVAALQAPVIMMSQNRMAVKDRLDARNDYEVNLRAEMEIMRLHEKLDAVRERDWAALLELQREQIEMLRRIQARLPDSDPAARPGVAATGEEGAE